MINIYYLQHRRNFLPILFYFLNRIKPENKKQIQLFLLNTDIRIIDQSQFPQDISVHIVDFSYNTFNNFRDKFLFALKQDSEYFFKLDEDIIFSEHVWNYMIENAKIVKQPDIITLSPIINIGVPSCDYFIDAFCTEEQKRIIDNIFLSVNIQDTAGKSWGINEFDALNQHTIRSQTWNKDVFQQTLAACQTHLKGVHPIRFCYEAQEFMMKVVLDNLSKFLSPNNFSPFCDPYISYLVNDICLYETEKIRKVKDEFGIDPYDEIPMNLFAQKYKLKHVFIQNAFALHTFFAYVSRKDASKWKHMYNLEHFIHDTILNKAKELHHFDL